MLSTERVIKHHATLAPFACAHCGLMWYGTTTDTLEGVVLCAKCSAAMDRYACDTHRGLYDQTAGSIKAHPQLKQAALDWVADPHQKPLPRTGDTRFLSSVPRWMRSAIDAGLVKPNDMEIYIVFSRPDQTVVRVKTTQDRSALRR